MFFNKKAKDTPWVTAIIAAAGDSSRMNGVDKQHFPILGIPAVARSIGSFFECPLISEIVVVCGKGQIPDYYDLVKLYSLNKVTSVVAGGDDRQASVFAGIEACGEKAEFYAIHDGARPLILQEEIERCVLTAVETGAAAVGVPVRDTIKVVDEKGVIIGTPDRKTLWAVQTPQIFEARLYKRAMAAAKHSGRRYTDDCQLVEAMHHPVTMVEGSGGNIKLTTPEDLAAANAILEYRQEGLIEWEA